MRTMIWAVRVSTRAHALPFKSPLNLKLMTMLFCPQSCRSIPRRLRLATEAVRSHQDDWSVYSESHLLEGSVNVVDDSRCDCRKQQQTGTLSSRRLPLARHPHLPRRRVVGIEDLGTRLPNHPSEST